ncbi:RNA chaperone Hfq [Paenibacillus sp. M1]|uniref:RNA-binding protein Hfq n=2 Tax=Paenibacillus haidiansis TaxID=1574488 RepID=A0ABU7VPE4_9BACL
MKKKDDTFETSQDHRLNNFRKNRTECTIITTNGVPLKGTIEAFDKYAVLLRTPSGRQSMVYKHAISTVVSQEQKKRT